MTLIPPRLETQLECLTLLDMFLSDKFLPSLLKDLNSEVACLSALKKLDQTPDSQKKMSPRDQWDCDVITVQPGKIFTVGLERVIDRRYKELNDK